MEKEVIGNFRIRTIYDEFPRIFEIELIGSEFDSLILVYESPFANCQTFTIGLAYKLSYLKKEEVVELFKIIYEKISRKQFVIDLKDEFNESVLESIESVIKEKYSIKYKSTNGSHMNLNIIQLDTDKLENDLI